ncbi:T9SS type A sorting domain-containing protein [Marivirga arenosa]|uniref:T9SS type A sorting domain-containing protein n=1 Tax=Marivirga arenosa TaxID=3059076 RepID=A0AA49GH94_9BACT|nr:T9SS type A sorting domain-containing protein [Marivirga sp. BKB1-2]WKK82389.2 T9SS type A sorting domain-containing protein [Marivirga sp. BKB1-2]
MFNSKFSFLLFLFITVIVNQINGQSVINSSGENISGTGGSVNFSIGQLTFDNYTGANGTVNQGIQNAYEISLLTSSEISLKRFSFTIFPNPVKDVLNLEIGNLDNKNMTYHLYKSNGRLLEKKNIKSNNISIDMKERIPDIYLLKINNGDQVLKIFRIVKY